MKLVTVHIGPWWWSAYDLDHGRCCDEECACQKHYAYGAGATEEAAIISFVQDLLEKRGADLYEVWPGAASEKKNCNVRLANPFRLKEEPCKD